MNVQSLPDCRHRGENVGGERWICNSPKMVVLNGSVSSDTCRSHCPYVDHTNSTPGERARNGNGILAQTTGARLTQTAPVTFSHIAAGVTAAPRNPSTLYRCLQSLKWAGFSGIRVFCDNGLKLSNEERRLCAAEISRPHHFGAWRNFVQTARDLLEFESDADGFLIVQDDAVFCRNVAALVTQSQFDRNTGVVLLGTPSVYSNLGRGFVSLSRRQANDLRAAWALLFPRTALEALVNHDLAVSWQGWANRKIERLEDRKGIDTFVGRVMNSLGMNCYAHLPSLVDHVGMSTLGHGAAVGGRSAAMFPTADFDAASLLRAPANSDYSTDWIGITNPNQNPSSSDLIEQILYWKKLLRSRVVGESQAVTPGMQNRSRPS